MPEPNHTIRRVIGPTILLGSGHYYDFHNPEGSELNDRVRQDRVDEQFPIDLFVLDGHVAIQPKQIEPDNSPHSLTPVKSREHEPVNSTCQIRELAA